MKNGILPFFYELLVMGLKMKLINEENIYLIWEHILNLKQDLFLDNGKKVLIYDPGKRNHYEGPDYFNCAVKINNKVFKGSVEIHRMPSDWYSHGHEKNELYNDVVLHISYYPQANIKIRKQDDRFAPNLTLSDFFDEEYTNAILLKLKIEESKVKHDCYKISDEIGEDNLIESLRIQGIKVLHEKINLISKEIQTGNYDEILYKTVMRSAGYLRNKNNFLDLAETLQFKKIRQLNKQNSLSNDDLIALLFGSAGFLNDDFKYLKSDVKLKYKKIWGLLKQRDNTLKEMENKKWKFFKVRPFNRPNVRIKKIVYLINNLLLNEHFVTDLFESNEIYSIKYFYKNISRLVNDYETDSKIIRIFGSQRLLKFCLNWFYPIYLYHLQTIKKIKIGKNFLLQYFSDIYLKNLDHIEKIFLKQLYGEDNQKKINIDPLVHLGIHRIVDRYCRAGECNNCCLPSYIQKHNLKS